MYEYMEFKKELVAKVQRILGDNVNVSVVTVEKCNGVAKEVLCLKVEGESNPQIHMGELYERYCDGELIDYIADGIKRIFESRDIYNGEDVFRDWEIAKQYLTVAVLNTKWNENLWEYTVHKEFLDLSFVCKCIFYSDDKIQASYNVLYEHLKEWNISEEELWMAALENFAKEEFWIKDIGNLLNQFSRKRHVGINNLFVISNHGFNYGAKVLLNKEYFEKLANKLQDDLYILPSSIKEVMCMPVRGNLGISQLQKMVRGINRAQVPEDEWLSDEVYYYSRETKEISIV